jgi:hypothetical protein
MLFTVDQINQIHAMLQEFPATTHVSVIDKANGSAIGPATEAKFLAWNFPRKSEILGTIDITDVGTW